jgi:hypothetical protein
MDNLLDVRRRCGGDLLARPPHASLRYRSIGARRADERKLQTV